MIGRTTPGVDKLSAQPLRGQQGFTMAEMLVTVAAMGILVVVLIPPMRCYLANGHFQAAVADLDVGRDRVELLEIESGSYPSSLAAIYGPIDVPPTVVYCRADGVSDGPAWVESGDLCTELMALDNVPRADYYLRTVGDQARCKEVDYAFVPCCGGHLRIVDVYGEVKGED